MSTELHRHVDDYLRLRRSLGFKLVFEGSVLPQFATWLQARGATVTADAAITWAQLPQGVNPITWVHRLGAVRGFARYLRTIEPATEIPPPDVFDRPLCRATPYLFSPNDVQQLLLAAARLRPALRAATCETVFGLLAATGMRIGEVLGLHCDEVDLGTGVLTITGPKFGRDRLVPLHPSTTEALRRYTLRRDQLRPAARAATYFVSANGARLSYKYVHAAFISLTTEIGLRSATLKPRMHDLRHSYIVGRLVDWYRSGADPTARMPALSTYVGHINPASTYWYLTTEPELMQLAAAKLGEHLHGGQVGGRS